jgi:hypothetical protein
VTLSMDAAREIARPALEPSLRARWVPRKGRGTQGWATTFANGAWGWGAVDEFLWFTELSMRGLAFRPFGLTYVYWCKECGVHVDNGDLSSPVAYLNRTDAAAACARARASGFFFARKFGDGSLGSSNAVASGLADCAASSPAVDPPTTGPATVEGTERHNPRWALGALGVGGLLATVLCSAGCLRCLYLRRRRRQAQSKGT